MAVVINSYRQVALQSQAQTGDNDGVKRKSQLKEVGQYLLFYFIILPLRSAQLSSHKISMSSECICAISVRAHASACALPLLMGACEACQIIVSLSFSVGRAEGWRDP